MLSWFYHWLRSILLNKSEQFKSLVISFIILFCWCMLTSTWFLPRDFGFRATTMEDNEDVGPSIYSITPRSLSRHNCCSSCLRTRNGTLRCGYPTYIRAIGLLLCPSRARLNRVYCSAITYFHIFSFFFSILLAPSPLSCKSPHSP